MIKIDPLSVVNEKFLDIPYRLGGRNRDGADCVGIAMMYLKDNGFDYSGDDINFLERTRLEHWYERSPRKFVEKMLEVSFVVPFSDVARLDLLLFFSPSGISKFPTGMGIMVDSRHFLAVLRPGETSTVHMLNMHWKSVLWGVLRLKKVAEANNGT